MKKSDFNFELPEDLIAQFPLEQRSGSRMLVYSRSTLETQHRTFQDLPEFLNPGDLLVFNDSRVIPARLFGQKASGGQVEIFVERILNNDEFLAQIRASKSPKPGTCIHLQEGYQIDVLSKQDYLYLCKASQAIEGILEKIGHVPLPPYIDRQDERDDRQRYQTIYAKHKGSVAAPTAGLHFDEAMFTKLQAKGVKFGFTTLHVGAGTFQPVRSEFVRDHHMHAERLKIDDALCAAVEATQAVGGRVIAVGSTALRSLESAAHNGVLKPCDRETNIFITPGYTFQICEGMITNFHLPESTLLMLVAAFIGYESAMALYRTAIEKQYRFFSYGDVSLLL